MHNALYLHSGRLSLDLVSLDLCNSTYLLKAYS